MYNFSYRIHTIDMNNKFLQCGVTGICLEVVYTGLISRLHHDKKMMGKTSILMFPIYGAAALFLPLSHLIKGWHMFWRGLVYMFCIFTGEYISGKFLSRHNMCPWNYSHVPFNIHGLIRLDFAPLWFLTGLLFERILTTHK